LGELAVEVAARRVRRTLRDANLPPPPPLPAGPFQLVYADPPWQLGNPDGAHAPENHYPCLPLEQIKHLAVPAAEDACLYLWAVSAQRSYVPSRARARAYEKEWAGERPNRHPPPV
jgi:hypothetical protein